MSLGVCCQWLEPYTKRDGSVEPRGGKVRGADAGLDSDKLQRFQWAGDRATRLAGPVPGAHHRRRLTAVRVVAAATGGLPLRLPTFKRWLPAYIQ